MSTNDPREAFDIDPPEDDFEDDDELAAETRGDQLYDYLTGK